MGQLLLASDPLCLWTAQKDGVGNHLEGHFDEAGWMHLQPALYMCDVELPDFLDYLLVVPVAAVFLVACKYQQRQRLCVCCVSLAPTVPGALLFSVLVIVLRVAWGWRPYHLPAKVLPLVQVSSCSGPIAPGLWPTVLVDRSDRRSGQPSGRAFR